MSDSNTLRWNEPVLAPTDVKRQHYVPRLYLRVFADEAEQLRVVDLDTGKSYRTSVANAAVVGRFNDVGVGAVVVSTESWLSQIEGEAAPLLGRLSANPAQLVTLDADEQMRLARFLAAMNFRVPAFREKAVGLRTQVVAWVKGLVKNMIHSKHEAEAAALIWADWERRPDEWWLTENEAFDTSALAASMLAEVQGFANLFWSMPWRVGRIHLSHAFTPRTIRLEGYFQPVHPWWEGGAFSSLTYYIPLSPSVLLLIDRLPYRNGHPVGEPGDRIYKDFSHWHVGMTLNIISAQSTRFLFGDGPTIRRDDARRDLADHRRRAVAAAKLWLGHSDRPPTLDTQTT